MDNNLAPIWYWRYPTEICQVLSLLFTRFQDKKSGFFLTHKYSKKMEYLPLPIQKKTINFNPWPWIAKKNILVPWDGPWDDCSALATLVSSWLPRLKPFFQSLLIHHHRVPSLRPIHGKWENSPRSKSIFNIIHDFFSFQHFFRNMKNHLNVTQQTTTCNQTWFFPKVTCFIQRICCFFFRSNSQGRKQTIRPSFRRQDLRGSRHLFVISERHA